MRSKLKEQGVFIGHHRDYNRNHDRESPLIGSFFYGGVYAGRIKIFDWWYGRVD